MSGLISRRPEAPEHNDARVPDFDHRLLDDLLLSRIRLAVIACLAVVEDAEFTWLRDQVRTTDGNLGAHLRKLEEAGYLEVEKLFVDRKPLSRYRLTTHGRDALRSHVRRLERLLPDAEEG